MPIGAVDANDRHAIPQGGRLVLCTNKKKHAVYKKKKTTQHLRYIKKEKGSKDAMHSTLRKGK